MILDPKTVHQRASTSTKSDFLESPNSIAIDNTESEHKAFALPEQQSSKSHPTPPTSSQG
jgi:hypothetical protein